MAVTEIEAIALAWSITSLIISMVAWRNSSVLKERFEFLHEEVKRFRDIVDKLRDEIRQSKR